MRRVTVGLLVGLGFAGGYVAGTDRPGAPAGSGGDRDRGAPEVRSVEVVRPVRAVSFGPCPSETVRLSVVRVETGGCTIAVYEPPSGTGGPAWRFTISGPAGATTYSAVPVE